jgi:hypothetical protein
MRSRKDLDDAISACDRTYIVGRPTDQGKNGRALFSRSFELLAADRLYLLPDCLLFLRQWKVYVLPRFRHKTRTVVREA